MSFDPDKRLPEREPEVSGPWVPPRMPRGATNPPETRRKAKAKLGRRTVKVAWRKPIESVAHVTIQLDNPTAKPIQYRVGDRISGQFVCAVCHTPTPVLVHGLPTARQRWTCPTCARQWARPLGR